MRIANKLIRAGRIARPLARSAPSVTLTLDERRRSRQRLTLDNGEAVGLAIERGTVLRDGDVIVTQDGGLVAVKAAQEDVLHVLAASPWQLARAAYHLGNRHVLLEIGEGYLQLEYDPVLADMLHRLSGVRAEKRQAPFEPDVGAYGGGHRHGHDETFDEDYALAQAAFHAHDHHHHHDPTDGHGHGHNHHGRDHHHGHDHEHDHRHGHGRTPAQEGGA